MTQALTLGVAIDLLIIVRGMAIVIVMLGIVYRVLVEILRELVKANDQGERK